MSKLSCYTDMKTNNLKLLNYNQENKTLFCKIGRSIEYKELNKLKFYFLAIFCIFLFLQHLFILIISSKIYSFMSIKIKFSQMKLPPK